MTEHGQLAEEFGMSLKRLKKWGQSFQPDYKWNGYKVLYTDGDDGFIVFSRSGDDDMIEIKQYSTYANIPPTIVVQIMDFFIKEESYD